MQRRFAQVSSNRRLISFELTQLKGFFLDKLSKLTKSANDKVMKIKAVSVDNNETVTDSISAQTKDAPTEKSQETITRKILIQCL